MERKPTEQIKFLANLRDSLPPTVSFVDQLAEVLSVSKDSAYRRIRGETILSLNEVKSLIAFYKIPLSALLSGMGESVNFQYQAVDGEKFTFENWISSLVDKLEIINSYPSPNKELIYYAKDVPIFYYFQFPELGAFKMFFG